MKTFLTTVALAALAASPAFAASHKRASQTGMAPDQAYSAYAAVPGRDVVSVNGQIAGQDPDANVRLQLRRDAESYVN